jgi:ATP-dependent helicase/nuclease subunit B
MVPELVRVRPGPTATAWLSRRIRRLQADDPLRPVTVVVPGHHAGIHLRRRLAAEGYANVRFTVLARLAESLGAGRLAARGASPLTAVTRAALVRIAIAEDGGPLALAADHAGLVDLVAGLAEELRRRADPPGDAVRILATGTLTARSALDTVAGYQRRRSASGLYDEVDLLTAASEALRAGEGAIPLRETGAAIVLLPSRLEPPEAELLRALAGRTPVVVAVAQLEDDGADLGAVLLGAASAEDVPATAPPAAVSALIVSDPVEEVRAAVRALLAAAEADPPVPLYRAAIVYRDEETYAPLLRDTLDEAGVPHAALDGRRLEDSVAARGLLGLIRLRDQDFTRATVLGWLSGLPHRGGVLRSQARWDQLSRDAGVVRGAAQWRERLAALAEQRQRSLDRLDEDPEEPAVEARRAALRRDVEDALRIVEHLDAIDAATRPPGTPTWEAHVAWAARLRDEFLAPDDAWSAEDREASQAVDETLRGLGDAQAVEPEVSVHVFLRALEDGLRSRRRPEGRIGRGVVVGPHRLLRGMDLDRVHVLGAVEAGFPPPAAVDPLLAGDPLGRTGVRARQERADWLAALAAADGGEALVSAPVVDVEGRAVYPSPWLLETLEESGERPRASAVRAAAVTHPRLRRAGGAPGTPLSIAERREWEAAAAWADGRDLSRTALGRRDDLPLGRVLETARARRSPDLTEFDGHLAAAAHLPLIARGLSGPAQSATGIETWSTCPFHHLMGRVLVVSPTEDVDDDRWWQIDAADRGTLVHAILERFFREVAETGHPVPGSPYLDEDVRRIEEIAAEVFRDAEVRGIVGHPLVWANERAAILADLRTLLREDAEQRAGGGWRPAYLEQAFGFDGEPDSWPAVTVPLADGRTAVLRGRIDRVDVDERGDARVIDYKTGSSKRHEITAANLLDHGRRLQLPIYGRAVRDRVRATGRPAPATTSLYWYATVKGGFSQTGLGVDGAIEEALAGVLGRIDAGVRAGCFPQVPGEFEEWWGRCENCGFCPYDSLCPASREVLAASKSQSPRLAPYRALDSNGAAEQGA